MVKETRHIFDLSDIESIRLQCTHCKREVIQSIGSAEVPKVCPMCQEEWECNLPGDARGHRYHLLRYMKEILKDKSPPMTIRFEIDGE